MGRPLRFIPDEAKLWFDKKGERIAIVVGTVRCIQGRYLLEPTERINSLILGVLGRAQHEIGFELYAYQFLMNHFDLMVGVRSAEHAAEVFRFINTNISKEIGREEHADWRGPMFERRMRQILVLTEDDVHDRFRYILSHGVKEGLVERPSQWPGVHCAKPLCEGRTDRGIWVDRTELWRIRKSAADKKKKPTRRATEATVSTSYAVNLTRIPGWDHIPDQDYEENVSALCREIAEETAERLEELGKKALGVIRVLQFPKHYKPDQVKRTPAPKVHCANFELRQWFLDAYALFKAAYAEAQLLWKFERSRPGARCCFPPGGIPPGRPDSLRGVFLS